MKRYTLWTDADWARATRCPAVHPATGMQCRHMQTQDGRRHYGVCASDKVDGGRAGMVTYRWGPTDG